MEKLKSLKDTYYKQLQITNLKFKILNVSRAGFTLLEIMIALAIVGAVVITILYTVNYHADTAYEHTVTTRMFLAAKEKITEMEQNPQDAKGDIPETDFIYENSVNLTEDENIIELKITISGEGKEVVLSELVFNKETQQ